MMNILKRIPIRKQEKHVREYREYRVGGGVMRIASYDLKVMDDYPSYMMGRTTRMTSMMWNLTRVTAREEIKSEDEATGNILDKELSNLCKLSHPNLLLLMGVCSGSEGETTRIIFEHVSHGSLYHWVHKKGKVPSLSHYSEIIIQISDALIFLHNLDYLHCAITSHAVQLVNKNVAKLCQLEFLVNCAETGGEGLGRHSQAVLDYAGWQSLYNWLSPEVLRGDAVSRISDIYSLCVLVYELSTGTIPLAQMSADAIQENMPSQGVTLPLDQETMPSELYQVLTRGLQADCKTRNLDIHQIRDVFQRIRDKIGNESHLKQNQMKQNTPTKPCPSRSLSSSAIQYNKNHYL